MPSLSSSLIFPSEHDGRLLTLLTQNLNPTPGSGRVVPARNATLVIREAPGEPARPGLGVEVTPPFPPRQPVPLLPVLQPLTSADVGAKRLRRRHERIKEQS